MCGIVLGINLSKNRISEMLNTMRHRGFEETISIVEDGNIVVGHIRLPIQGLDRQFDQPYLEKNSMSWMVGELFNFRSFDPSAKSDLPVLAKRFLHDNVDGFWSFVSKKNDSLVIDINELAKKPLYIRQTGDYIAIASEIKALRLLGLNSFDEFYFSTVAKWGYFPGNRTPFNEIKKLSPGTYSLSDSGLKLTWESKLFPRRFVDIRKELEIAVKNRLVSDQPVSLLCSGGLDSTIILELVKKITKDITVFHIDNEEAEYLNFIDFKGIKLKKLEIPSDYNLKEILYYNETPVDLGSVIPQFLLAEAIKKEGFHVTISGDGADELFGGYRRIAEYDSQYSDIFHELIYYHLPRLDKLMMAKTIELRCPFLAKNIICGALGLPYSERMHKKHLKEIFSDVVPKAIIDRKKEPLKIKDIKLDKMKHRMKMIKSFRYLVEQGEI